MKTVRSKPLLSKLENRSFLDAARVIDLFGICRSQEASGDRPSFSEQLAAARRQISRVPIKKDSLD